jgi:hypothetical protein
LLTSQKSDKYRLPSLCAPKISFNIINKQTQKTQKMFKLHNDTERLELKEKQAEKLLRNLRKYDRDAHL